MNDLLKYIYAVLLRFILSPIKLIPTKNNRVVFNSYNGNQYSCNPRCISERIQKENKYEIIWAFKDPQKFKYLGEEFGYKLCKYRSFKYYFYSLTAKVTVCNAHGAGEMPIREDHFEIQTWHGGGGGYKKSALDDKTITNRSKYRYENDDKRYSLMCTSSKTSLKNTVRGGLDFEGMVVGGTPRNDLLINRGHDELYSKVHTALGISSEKKILLYAPTWRVGHVSSGEAIDSERLKKSLSKRFGGEWVIAIRSHYLASKNRISGEVDASNYPDMQELLYVVDALMTDYSSSIWDFSFTYKPCFLYCLDLKNFKQERDFYSPINTWGFPLAENEEQLNQVILDFNQEVFQKNMVRHHEINGSFEKGTATEDMARIIEAVCFNGGKMPEDIAFV